MECDYFYLRALVKNSDRVRSKSYTKHLSRQARRAMGIAFVDGPEEHYAAILDLAWPYLSPQFRMLYRFASILPSATRTLIRAKRHFVMRKLFASESSKIAGL
jgi:hypothetical protein